VRACVCAYVYMQRKSKMGKESVFRVCATHMIGCTSARCARLAIRDSQTRQTQIFTCGIKIYLQNLPTTECGAPTRRGDSAPTVLRRAELTVHIDRQMHTNRLPFRMLLTLFLSRGRGRVRVGVPRQKFGMFHVTSGFNVLAKNRRN